jgi:hypothetical protein
MIVMAVILGYQGYVLNTPMSVSGLAPYANQLIFVIIFGNIPKQSQILKQA